MLGLGREPPLMLRLGDDGDLETRGGMDCCLLTVIGCGEVVGAVVEGVGDDDVLEWSRAGWALDRGC